MSATSRARVVEPMLATLVDELPRADGCPGGCLFEPKWDGFRALAWIDEHGGVTLTSRRAKTLTTAFPDIVNAVYDTLPTGTTVDGEIVRWSPSGRLDFGALQRRNRAGRRGALDLAKTEPCHYVAFDILEHEGRDTTREPLSTRRRLLEELLADVPGTSPIVLGMQTSDRDQAQQWLTDLAPVGIEGLIVKAAHSRYEPGRRGWSKVKAYATTEALVGGVTGTPQRPEDLVLGRYNDHAELLMVGRSSALHAAAAAELAELLTPAGDDHPWPTELPPSWTAVAYGRREPVQYVRVVPNVVVEVRADVATQDGRWRHALRYLRARPDVAPDAVPHNLNLEA